MVVSRFDIFQVDLNPTRGKEINKTRPCVIISPDSLNRHLSTVILAPLTSTRKPYPSRVDSAFRSKPGQIALDQLRTVDKQRLGKKVGTLDKRTARAVLATLLALFAP